MFRLDAILLRLPFMNILSDRDVMLLYFLRAVRDLINKFTLFFLPVYLYVLGTKSVLYNEWHFTNLQAGMLAIAAYFLVLRLVILGTAIAGGRITHQIGFTRSLLVSYIIRCGGFLALYFSMFNPWLILLAGAFEGLQSNFFWNTFLTVLTKYTPKKNMGANLGLLQFVLQLIAVLSPLVSGLIAVEFGFEVLFLTGVLLTFLSIGIILLLKGRVAYDQVSWSEFWRWMQEVTFRKLGVSFIGRYLNDAILTVWPLYIFLLLGSVEKVGFLYTFSLFVAMVMTFFIGMYIDRSKSKRPFIISGSFLSLLWIARTQVFSIWSIALVDMWERFFANFHWLYYDMLALKRGKGAQAFSYFVYREVVISAGAIIFWLFFAVYFVIFTHWAGLFILASGGVLLSLLVSDKYDRDVK